jgi:hypothetical protein
MKRALSLVMVVCLAGCATLFGGSSQIPIATNPPGAGVYVNGALVAQTPTVIELDSSRPAHIQIYLPGFQPVQIARHKGIAGWFWVNFFFWPGFIVDLATGKYEKYDSSTIAIGLTPAPQDQPPPNYQQPYYPQQPPVPPGPAPVQPGVIQQPPPPPNR